MSVPAWLQNVRALRPTHVMSVLPRGSGTLLLSPRDLRRAAGGPLPRITVPAPRLLPAVLRGVRDAGCLATLAKPHDGPAPQFVAAVLHAVDEVGFQAPLALASPPLLVAGGQAAGERLRGEIQRYLDVGFTELVLSAPDAAAGIDEALRVALPTVREREVPVAVHAAQPSTVRALVDALRGAGVAADLVIGGNGDTGGVGRELPLSGAVDGLVGVDASGALAQLVQRAGMDEARLEALAYADVFASLARDPFRGMAGRVLRTLAEQPVT